MSSSFNAYYINLINDSKRKKQTLEQLEKTNLNFKRFEAIDGNTIDKHDLITKGIISKLCKCICTNKTIGCGVSHIMLYKYIEEHDKNDFSLILEDDIIVTEPLKDYNKEIYKIVNYYNTINPSWHIIRLHSILHNTSSNAAYLINHKFIHKLSNTILQYHIDIQQYIYNNVVHLNTLFDTRDKEINYDCLAYNIFYDNQKIGFYMNTHICRFMGENITIYKSLLFLSMWYLLFLLNNVVSSKIILVLAYISFSTYFLNLKCWNKIPI